MRPQQPLRDGTLVDADIFQTACGIVMGAVSLKSVSRHTDVVDAIAEDLQAERARMYNECVERFGTDAEMGYQVGG